jgi:hypothetical protein
VRQGEIEQNLLARVYAVSGPDEPARHVSLRSAVSAALEYGLTAVERGEEHAPPVPEPLLEQARIAARRGIGLETLMRRYFAGHALLEDFLIEEIERDDAHAQISLKPLLRSQAALLDRLLERISEEYQEESRRRLGSSEQRRTKRIERLLDGELIDTSGLAYDFESFHTGVVGAGPGVADAIRDLARLLKCRLLLIRRNDELVWAWLGARRAIGWNELKRRVSGWPSQHCLSIGEPAKGLRGWRQTHQQARAALPIAVRKANGPLRYADVSLLASVFRDELLVATVRDLYLSPLADGPDHGQTALETLRAYVAAERNVSSAAAALGLNRRSVAYRLRAIESRLGCSLNSAMAEIEIALQLQDLDVIPGSPGKSS